MSRAFSDSNPEKNERSPFAERLQRARRGDRAALADLLNEVRPKLQVATKGLLGKSLRTKLRSSDIVQTAFLEIIRDFDSFQGTSEGAFYAWAISVMQNAIRRTDRTHDAQKRRGPGSLESAARLHDALHHNVPSPSTILLRHEHADLVKAALAALTDEHREVIDLAVIKGLSHREIAERLGRSEGATRMLLVRARAAFALTMRRLEPGSSTQN